MTGPGWDYEEVYAAVDGSAIWRNGVRFVPAAEPADQIPPEEVGACCGHEYRRHLVGLHDCADCEKWEPEHARCEGWRRQLEGATA